MAARASALRQIARRVQILGQYGPRATYSAVASHLNPPNHATDKGFTAMNRLDRLEKKIDELNSDFKKRIDNLEKMVKDVDAFRPLLWDLRASKVLESAAGVSGPQETRYPRIMANIKQDLEALDFLRSRHAMGRWHNASLGFEITYGLFPDDLKRKISTAPEEMVGILDKRGLLQKHYIWDQYPEEKKAWISTCDRIVDAWLYEPSSSYSTEKVKEEYDNLCREVADKEKAM